MSGFKVDTDSLKATETLLLTCAGQLVNAPTTVGGGTPTSAGAALHDQYGLDDCVNGAWGAIEGLTAQDADLSAVLVRYSNSLGVCAENVKTLSKLLARAARHYEQADQDVADAAGGARC
jgi:hypothetical protein